MTEGLISAVFITGLLLALLCLVLAVRGRWYREAIFAQAPLRPTKLEPYDLLVWFVLHLLGGQAAVMAVGRVDPDSVGPAEGLPLYLATSAGAWVPVVIWGVIRGGMGWRPWPLGRVARYTLGGAALGLPLVWMVSVVSALVAEALDMAPPDVAHPLLRAMQQAEPSVMIGYAVFAIVVAPLLEEAAFRGVLQTAAIKTLGRRRWPGILIVSGVFAVFHAGAVPVVLLPTLFVLAVVLGWVYERSGSLWAPITLHAVFNGANVALLLSMPREAAGG